MNHRWMGTQDHSDPFIQQYLSNPVALYFKEPQARFPGEYGEIFLTKGYGELVASTAKLTTLAHAHKYWWKGDYSQGQGAIFFDDRGYDYSVGVFVAWCCRTCEIKGRDHRHPQTQVLNILGSISQIISEGSQMTNSLMR